MVDPLVGLEPFLINFIDELFLTPYNIPIIVVSSLKALLLEALADAIGEVGLELYFGSTFRTRIHKTMVFLLDAVSEKL